MVTDITERKRVEQELEQSEKKYRLIAQNVTDVIWITGMDLRPAYISPSVTRLLGYSIEEAMAGTLETRLTPTSVNTAAETMARALASPKPEEQDAIVSQPLELEIKHKDGSTAWTSVSLSFIRGSDGQPVQIVGILRNITERKKAEEALRASEERYRLLVENAYEGIGVFEDGKVVFANPQLAEIVGFSKEELTSMPFLELIHPDDRQIVTERYIKRLKGEEIPSTYAVRAVDKAGNVKWVEANSALLTWNGRPTILGLVTDITNRKRAEEELRESEKRYRLLFDVTPVVTSITTPEGRALAVNNAIREMSGYTPEEFVTLNMNDIYIDPGERRRMRALLQREGRVRDFETVFRRKDGLICIVLLNADTIELDNQRLILATVRDITERKQAEEEIQGLLDSVAQERDKLSSLVNSITDEVWFADTQKNFTLVNPVALREFGYSSANPINVEELARSLEVYRPDGSPRPVEEAPPLRALKGEIVQNMEEIVRTPVRGELRYRHVSAAPVRDTSGNIIGSVSVVRDITDRKRAEEELQRQQKRFRALIENASDAITIAGADGTISYESPSCERMSGFKPEELIGANIIERIHPNDINLLSDTFSHLMRHPGSTTEDEIRLRHKDGTWLTVEATVTNLLHDPAVNGIVVNLRDITERKKAEEALKASEAKFRGLFEHMASGGAVYEAVDNGEDFVFKDFNPAAEKIEKSSKEDVLGRRVTEAFPGVKGFGVFDVFQRVWRTGKPEYFPEAIYRDERDPGTWRESWVYKLPSGEIVAVYNNITERKRAEEALQESEQKFRAIFDNANDGFISVDPESGRFLNANRRMIQMLGYESKEEVKDLTASDIHPRENLPYILREFEKHMRREISRSDELPVKRKDGSVFFASISSYLVTIANKTYLSCIFRDVTEHKQAEAIREAFYRRLVDVQEKERQAIARELHDEIGQPLTVIKLYLDRKSPQAAGDVDPQIEEARKVLLGLIHQVRNMSVNLRPTMLDELGLLPTLLWHFERYTRQTKISVNFRHTGLKRPLPPEVANTAYRLVQEGLTNVARHAQVSEVMVHIRARRNSLIIEVRDHGIGFDLSKVAGKGIGLTGMYERALALNGTLTIESTPGTGTCLLAELPLSKGSEKEIKTKKGSGKNSVNG